MEHIIWGLPPDRPANPGKNSPKDPTMLCPKLVRALSNHCESVPFALQSLLNFKTEGFHFQNFEKVLFYFISSP
jgi:hypothetical protein